MKRKSNESILLSALKPTTTGQEKTVGASAPTVDLAAWSEQAVKQIKKEGLPLALETALTMLVKTAAHNYIAAPRERLGRGYRGRAPARRVSRGTVLTKDGRSLRSTVHELYPPNVLNDVWAEIDRILTETGIRPVPVSGMRGTQYVLYCVPGDMFEERTCRFVDE